MLLFLRYAHNAIKSRQTCTKSYALSISWKSLDHHCMQIWHLEEAAIAKVEAFNQNSSTMHQTSGFYYYWLFSGCADNNTITHKLCNNSITLPISHKKRWLMTKQKNNGHYSNWMVAIRTNGLLNYHTFFKKPRVGLSSAKKNQIDVNHKLHDWYFKLIFMVALNEYNVLAAQVSTKAITLIPARFQFHWNFLK